MAGSRLSGADFRQRRRWSFADCIFDEANWALIVGGRRVSIETKPLEMLRELLLSAGNLVSKEELLDRIWPDVEVVEASLTTAVAKLRRALRDDQRKVPIIKTVPRLGYRLAVPVEVEDLSGEPTGSITTVRPANDDQVQEVGGAAEAPGRPIAKGSLPRFYVASGLAMVAALAAFAFVPTRNVAATRAAGPYTQRDAANALRKMDVGAIEQLLAAGWDPNTPFDDQDNGALNMLLNICEWNREHDRSQMLLMARTLIDGGAKLDHRNVWGDTPYSIAKAQRYCGPNHPVTKSIRTICYAGYKPFGDRCLASYEIARRDGS